MEYYSAIKKNTWILNHWTTREVPQCVFLASISIMFDNVSLTKESHVIKFIFKG